MIVQEQYKYVICWYFCSKIDAQVLQYPSVSVCIEYTFKTYLDDEISKNNSLKKIEALVKDNVWKRNDTVYFLNQRNSKIADYPCLTTSESSDAGRPCSFPFDYLDVVYQNCSNAASEQPWCYTKLENDSLKVLSKNTYYFFFTYFILKQ